jgi:hypothetical protein
MGFKQIWIEGTRCSGETGWTHYQNSVGGGVNSIDYYISREQKERHARAQGRPAAA